MHKSVLLKELINNLEINPADVVVDATINGGGHAKKISEILNKEGTIIGFDLDKDAINEVSEKLEEAQCKKILINENFRNLKDALTERNINSFDKIYFDLGLSSNQLDKRERGFSYRAPGPLTMTFEKEPTDEQLTAKEIVNEWEEENIADIIYGYGEEKSGRRIAKAIINARKEKEIKGTKELAEIIENALPRIPHLRKVHPARKTFQALRITVNDELNALKDALGSAIEMLNPNGRIAVISFHRLEDRIVKNQFKKWSSEETGKILTKKPITPSKEEADRNTRSRSSKFRVFKKF